MVFQDVGWTIIADGMSSAEVEIAKVISMSRVIPLAYNHNEMSFYLYENIYDTFSNTR